MLNLVQQENEQYQAPTFQDKCLLTVSAKQQCISLNIQIFACT